MIDSHAHLTDKRFNADLDTVVNDSIQDGVTQILTVATNLDDAKNCLKITKTYDCVSAGIGVHPHDAKSWDVNNSERRIQEMLQDAVAVGEIGLDYYYNFSEPGIQREVFTRQLDLAMKCNKPVIIHCRDAFDDLLDLIGNYHSKIPGGVIHCFTGNQKVARSLLDWGFYLGFTGMTTFPKLAEIREMACYCPVDRILLETDCPYLAPVPFRGKRNYPGYVKYVYEQISTLKCVGMDSLIQQVQNNYMQCFKLS